ncbi:hypothetical protein DSO57_1009378 [Entomophthora muscae]|uniref:Uncharacterized protein n=1 Tax=Entomophthora muscae TaxID=34485 RepID=A0ACC2SJQ4_9FUNG|nr:hypothetical protein DSO57_1009378 [Entomophthora muscae]
MLKYVTKIDIKFAPFNPNSGPAKYFLNQIYTDKNLESNPKCKINANVSSIFDTTPFVSVTFKDGKLLNLKTDNMKVKDIVSAVKKHSTKLALLDDSKSN